MNPISIRLLNQQLIAPQFSKPEEVVSHFGAMQAQEYRMMRWAVEMRTRLPSEKAFTKAFNEGKIVRLHLLRGTWQLVSAEDYWWMLDLCATKAKQVINGWMSSNKIAIHDEELSCIRNLIVETIEKKVSVTKEDFEESLATKGITMDDHRLSYHIRFAELDGVICSGNLLPMKATYAISEIDSSYRAYRKGLGIGKTCHKVFPQSFSCHIGRLRLVVRLEYCRLQTWHRPDRQPSIQRFIQRKDLLST